MNNLLYQQIDELLTRSDNRAVLECERPLRIAAATLCRSASGVITATTVVCDFPSDDLERVESLVDQLADEYGLETCIRPQRGSFSVRFTRPLPDAPVASVRSERSLLAKLLGRDGRGGQKMLDVVFLAITVAFFVVALGYAAACDRGIGAT